MTATEDFEWMIEKLGTDGWQKFCHIYNTRVIPLMSTPSVEERIREAKAGAFEEAEKIAAENMDWDTARDCAEKKSALRAHQEKP